MCKNKVFFFALIPILILGLWGCGSYSSLEKANKAYDLYQFNVAATQYKAILSKTKEKKEKQEITFKIAECYRSMNEYAKAQQFYERAIKLKYLDPTAIYWLAEMLKRQEKYEEALIQFKNFAKENPGDTLGQIGITSCENAIKWKEERTRYVVENEKILNTKYNDFAPMFYQKGSVIITSDREDVKNDKLYDWTGMKYTDIFVSEILKGKGKEKDIAKLQKPLPFDETGAINSSFNDGVVSFDKKFNTMYYTQCNGLKGKEHNCKIYVTTRKKGNEWTDPEVLPFCTDTFAKYGHPSLSPDEKRLYFSSDMSGGLGKHDIYMTSYVKRGKTWSDPANLGPVINTAGDELFPFIYSDNKTLYFSSDGHPGMGGLDVFRSVWDGDKWSKPENMKPPINSGADDFSIIVKPGGTKGRGYAGYFSSNRPGSRLDDIYSFYMTPLKFTLSGTVFNKKKPGEVVPDATVVMSINDTGKVVAISDKSGYYKFELLAENNYMVFASKKFFFDSEEKTASTMNLELSEDFIRDLHLDPFITEEIELEGIYYDLDKYDLRPESMVVLDSLYNILLRHPYIVIEIASHTDCRATIAYNQTLSENRAKSVVDYLIAKGIPPDRLVAKGYGESMLINRCACENDTGAGMNCLEEEHQQNRRTTFKILRTDYVYGESDLVQPENQPNQPKDNKKKPNQGTINNPKTTNKDE